MFVVFSLPRSRSAWLSLMLARHGQVGHDIGVECSAPDDFVRAPFLGTCETGAAFAAPLIRKLLPAAKFVVVKREARDVAARLIQLGYGDQSEEMRQRSDDLNAISSMFGTLTVQYEDLKQYVTCNMIHAHCLGRGLDWDWWRTLDVLNVQVDLPRERARLAINAGRIAALKAAVRG